MTEQGNPSIYDIDFAILDEKKYGRAVKKLDPVIEVPTVVEAVEGIVEPFGRVALATEIIRADTTKAESVGNELDEGVEVSIPREEPIVEIVVPSIPEDMLQLARGAVDAVLEDSTKKVIPIAMFIDKAFGQKVPREKFKQFKNALYQDPRLVYLGSGDFRIVEAEKSAVYWPGETPDVDMDRIEELSVEVLQAMELATKYPGFQFDRLGILGTVKSMGEYLSKDEENELLARLASNPRVSVYEDGKFRFLKDFSIDPDVSEDGLRIVSLDFSRKPEIRDKPMTDKQIGRTMNNINSSVAVRKAADLAKRRANPRKRRKRNKLQGKTHNKAQRLQTFVTKMMESTPPVAAIPNAINIDELKVDDVPKTSPVITKPAVQETVPEIAQVFESAKVSDYEGFAKKHFGEFPDMPLLITAFTHRSYLNENMSEGLSPEHNERLEYLGDAVLYMAVSEHLYRNSPEAEGILTQWRTALVRNSTISTVAEQEGFEPLLRLSRGFRNHYMSSRQQILANCYEAVIGAVYIAKGSEAAKAFVVSTLLPVLDRVIADGSWRDPKGRLQELLQKDGGALPEYREVDREGPDHNKVVLVGVYIGDKLIAEGAGNGTKNAQVAAATNALDVLTNYREKPRDPKVAGAH